MRILQRDGLLMGTCAYGTTNDIGIIWPPRGAPIVLAVYYTQDQENTSQNDAMIVSVMQIILKAYSQNRARKFSNNGQTSTSQLG